MHTHTRKHAHTHTHMHTHTHTTYMYQSNTEMYVYFTSRYHGNHPSIYSSIVMVCVVLCSYNSF